MHVKPIKIDSVNTNGVVRALVPVPSLEVRKNYQNAWFFRLSAELNNCLDKGYKIGFFTLTYADEHLPFLPSSLFGNQTPFEPIQCFRRSDVRNFIQRIRKWFWDNYQVKSVKYLVASEFGEHTQRSHYHGLIAWPQHAEFIDEVTGEVRKEPRNIPAEVVHSAICKYWSVPKEVIDPKTHLKRMDYEDKLGFVFPKDPRGGCDSHGYYHKPFELEANPVLAARYACKYVCKDLAFLDKLKGKQILKENGDEKLREYDCFHIQSKSLGLCVLENATPEQKLDWIKNGFWFVGQDKPVDIPIYIRNKILFDPYYIVDEQGNRLVRRTATKFFIDNYQEIFDKKVDIMEQQFVKMMDWQFWYKQTKTHNDEEYNNKVADICWRAYVSFMDDYGFTPRELASKYISRFGCDPDTLYNVPDSFQWVARYIEDNVLAGYPHIKDYDSHIEWNRRLELILSATRFFSDVEELSKQQFDHKIQDFWKSCGT